MTLKQKLEYHYKAFDKSRISPDPLQFLHLYKDEKDIEIAGFISSVFAYGNVKQIINTLEKIFKATEGNPYQFVLNFNENKEGKNLKGIKHRFYTEGDLILLFSAINLVLNEHVTLKNLFLNYYSPKDKNIKNALSGFSYYFIESVKLLTGRKYVGRGIKFMFPLPELGSACKRMNLFLRWMVRKDELDFGLWKEIPADKLIIPVDTHVARICKSLRLTERKIIGWKMAEEITENLKKYDPVDPVKYDFAICHIGMRKIIF